MTILTVRQIQNNYYTEYYMGPVRNFADKKEVYFDAKVNNIESKVNKDKALLHITLALKYDSNFPSNMFQAQFKLGNWSSEKIPLQKAPDKKSDLENKIHYFYATLEVPRTALIKREINRISEYIREELTIAFRLDRKSDRYHWSNYNLFDTVAADMYQTVIKETVTFGNMIRLNQLEGEKEGNIQQSELKYGWTMLDYRNMGPLEEVNNLINIKFNQPVKVVSVGVTVSYTAPDGKRQELKDQAEYQHTLNPNEEFKLNFPRRLSFNRVTKKLDFDPNGSAVFLPQGGFGSYEIKLEANVGNQFYTIVATNSFEYAHPFDDPKTNDFFLVQYAPVYSLFNFSDLIQ